MPFAHWQYRILKQSTYDYNQRRKRFLIICGIYATIFLILGAVFLGLYISQEDNLVGLNCSICNEYEANVDCGYHLCCDNYWNEYTYAYCYGYYAHGIFFILFICFLGYGLYEIVLMICTLINGSGLQRNDVIVIEQSNQYGYGNQQYIGMNNYQNYQYPNDASAR